MNAADISASYMVTPVGLEPTTFCSGGKRSHPLSYGAMVGKYSEHPYPNSS